MKVAMTDRDPGDRVLLLPKDTNAYGTIFGGVILSQHRPGVGGRGAASWRRTAT